MYPWKAFQLGFIYSSSKIAATGESHLVTAAVVAVAATTIDLSILVLSFLLCYHYCF